MSVAEWVDTNGIHHRRMNTICIYIYIYICMYDIYTYHIYLYTCTYIYIYIYIYSIYIKHHIIYKHRIQKEKMNNWVLQFLENETKKNLVLQNISFTPDAASCVLLNSGWRGTKLPTIFLIFRSIIPQIRDWDDICLQQE